MVGRTRRRLATIPLVLVAVVGCAPAGPALSVRFSGAAPVLSGLLRAPSPLPPGPPGSLVASETLAPNEALPGTSGHRVLYRSTGASGETNAVSGSVLVPAGTPPPGGWPVVSWAHGTVGVTDACAPSRSPEDRLYNRSGYGRVDDLLDAGVMVVATDYPGLGTDGPHPYLDGVSSGRAVLDIARLASVFGGSRRVVIDGFSQGGHAALFAGRLAPTYAPDLDVVGVSAVGPASHLVFATAVQQLGFASGYAGLIAYGRLAADPSLNAGDVLTGHGVEALSDLDDTRCGDPWIDPAADFRADFLQVPSWVDSFTANEPGNEAIAAPVLLVQGSGDLSVPQIATELLCVELGSRGTSAVRWLYTGRDHVGSADASRADRHRWLLDRLTGSTASPAPTTPSVDVRAC